MSKPGVKVRFYRSKNKLKEKSAGLGLDANAVIEFDEGLLSEAEEALNEMSEEYPDWVMTIIDELFEVHRRCVDDEVGRKGYFERINSIAHDMKGQGGSFGYDLMTILGNDLCRFIEGKKTASDVDIEVIDLYISTMQIVISKRMSGDGGPAGNEVLTGLAAVVAKITS